MSGSAPRWFRLGGPVVAVALVAGGAAFALHAASSSSTRSVGRSATTGAYPVDANGAASGEAGEGNGEADGSEPATATDPRGETEYRCVQPAIEIAKTEPCARGADYPACRWQLPDGEAADGLYAIWRNTIDEHRWARPGLVSLVMATAADYRARWPGEHLTIGDLDAPGPRHQTHDRGVDVDLYLTDAMIARNEGGGRYPDNYENRSRREVRQLRARVMELAKILATCARGQIRIYYNDPDLVRPFRQWFTEQGYESSVGRPMRMHNDLHRFHFHLTIPENTAPLPVE